MVDFGKTARDYGKFRAGFPEAFFDRLSTFGIGLPGQRVLDLGTGAGTVARGLALRGCRVIGLDPSEALIAEAKRLDREAGIAIEYKIAKAEDTGLSGGSFDVITAGQCWHWFDRPRAAQAACRLLRENGVLVIAHFDWLPLPGNMVEITERLIERYNPQWALGGGSGLHPACLKDVAIAGFEDIETFSFDTDASYSHEAWRGRIRASAGVAAALQAEVVQAFDEELAFILKERFPQDPMKVPHRVFAVVCRAPDIQKDG